MPNRLVQAIRTPGLLRKVALTLGIILVFRLGSNVPVPGVAVENVRACTDAASGEAGLLGLANAFSGGALLQVAVFALGILPYITASIIVQLLTVVIPRLESLKKEGHAGQAKITQYTRYLTVALAVLQGTGLVSTARNGSLFPGCPAAAQIVPDKSIFAAVVMIITITAGTACAMWLGELITDRGVGNGMSILVFISIASTLPATLWGVKQSSRLAGGWIAFGSILLAGFALVALVVFVEQAQRRIPVQYAKRMIGRKSYGGTSTYIPIKINQAGIIPVIFASSILYVPPLVVQFSNSSAPWAVWIERNLVQVESPYYIIAYFLLTVFFAFFYVKITFNPSEIADNIKQASGFIPGLRAGRPTAEYLDYVLTRLTWPGATYLGLIALVPTVAFASYGGGGANQLSGTSILITVSVGLETVKQINSQLQQHSYEGFLKT